jgi:hypothetical protein
MNAYLHRIPLRHDRQFGTPALISTNIFLTGIFFINQTKLLKLASQKRQQN